MRIRITFSSNDYKYIYQVIFSNIITYLDITFTWEQNDIILLNRCRF
jgi:hypothetical protein